MPIYTEDAQVVIIERMELYQPRQESDEKKRPGGPERAETANGAKH